MTNFIIVYLMYLPFISIENVLFVLLQSIKDCLFPNSKHLFDHAFDLIHWDVWGPFAKATHDGFRYFLIIVDDATRSTWVYLMKSKTKTSPLLISFCKMVFTQFQTNIKVIRTDNAQEFYAQHGIIH